MDSGDLCRWRAFLRGSSLTVFDIIENAIMVAALDHPQEFKARREKIVMKLYQCDLPSFSTHDSQISVAGRKISVSSIRQDESQGSKKLLDRDVTNYVKYDGEDKDGEKVSCDGDSDVDSLIRGFCEDITKQLSDEGVEEDGVAKEEKMDSSVALPTQEHEEAKSKKVLENNDTLEEVSKIKKVLENSQNHLRNDEVIVELLRKLVRIDFNMETLQATMIGETVSPLGKHGFSEIRHLARYLIAKWQMVVDEALDKSKSNVDDKISESCLGDHNVVQCGSSNSKEPSLDLQQQLPPDNFFEGMDLLKIFDDVDEENLLNTLPPDDDNVSNELSLLSMLNVDEEQHIHEKATVIEKKPTGKIKIRLRATPNGNGDYRKATTERALQAKESNLKGKGTIETKYNKQDSTIKTSQKLKRTDDVGKVMTLEEASKVIKEGYQRVVKKRRVVQMLDLNDLNELNAKYQKK